MVICEVRTCTYLKKNRMAFFFKPPRGSIALHTVKTCVHQRLKYLMSVMNNDASYEPEKVEYLITGSSMDRAGHYMLRLLAISSVLIREFFVKAETILFSARIKFLSSTEILTNMRISVRHISESVIGSGELEEFLVNVKHIFEKLSIRKIVDHIFSEDHSTECEQYTLKAPFTLCLSLVRQRKVSLKDGVADIPCGVCKIFLLELFEKHIVFGMEQLVNTGCSKEASQDPRIRELRKELEKLLLSNPTHITPAVLKACDVDTESVFFPLCMTHLHQTLRTRHRLSHEWRRQYTLFLKDIGMPVEEAIVFWSSEYSLPKSNSCGGCCHSWQKDAKRFHYSIRHMYGLEGGRYNYMVASCSSLQMAVLQSSAEGGCPFKHFDEEKLTSYFPSHIMEDDSVLNYILQLKKTSPKKACQAHLLALSRSEPLKYSFRTDEGKSSFKYYSPAHYYLSLKNT